MLAQGEALRGREEGDFIMSIQTCHTNIAVVEGVFVVLVVLLVASAK